MPIKPSSIDRFVAFIKRRGIAERFEPLYRMVAADLLNRFKKPSLDMVGQEHVKQYLAQEEQRLQNLRVVCVALEAYFADALTAEATRRKPPPPQQRQQGAATAAAAGAGAKRPLPAPPKSASTLPSARASSPAFTSPESGEQRRYVRIPFVREIAVEGAMGKRASADLSIGGMYVELGAYTPVGTVVQVRFKLEDDQPPISLAGRVVDGDPGGGCGLCFVDASPEIQGRIQRFVEKVVRKG
ncbi:MAG: PilZ domain-containing protein [Deltaproteobacteria bacterium]|jgi:hypothetical protein|nr:PilZ domain-containing protein [Deltaproteobacteria bacterium]MBW2530287.1 PilZ domain-containing protein [Deltaproteobacteria bacterium]